MAIHADKTAHVILLLKVEYFLQYLPQLRGGDALPPIHYATLLLEMAAEIEIPAEGLTKVNEKRWRLGSIIDELESKKDRYSAEIIGLFQAFRRFASAVQDAHSPV